MISIFGMNQSSYVVLKQIHTCLGEQGKNSQMSRGKSAKPHIMTTTQQQLKRFTDFFFSYGCWKYED